MEQQNSSPLPQFYIQFREFDAPGKREAASDSEEPDDPPLVRWQPAETKAGFIPTQKWPWHFYHEQPGKATIFRPCAPSGTNDFSRPRHLVTYQTASLIYSTELSSFFEVPYDCTLEDVCEKKQIDNRDGWDRMTFGRAQCPDVQSRHEHLWFLGHALQGYQIGSNLNITDAWEDLLLPGSFEKGVQDKNTFPTCELAGKLTMIFGAVAFATSRSDSIAWIKESFRPAGNPYYVPTTSDDRRPRQQGLINRRGIVIEIAFDPKHCDKKQLSSWEEGHHGPILTSYGINNNQADGLGMPLQPALHFTAA